MRPAKTLGPNHYVLYAPDGEYFQSYDSIVAFIPKVGDIQLDEHYWDYSMTTGKYRNMFLGETKNETSKKIDRGIYKLTNLNKK